MSIIDFKLESQQFRNVSETDTTEDRKTSVETATAARAWFMTVSLRQRPRCFGCGGRMIPKTVHVRHNRALCEICVDHDWSRIQPFWNAMADLAGPLEVTPSRGILFWTPPATLPDEEAYLRWLDLWTLSCSRSALAADAARVSPLPRLQPQTRR